MAYNKEYLIFVLDIRHSTPQEFKDKSIKCCAEVMKQRICAGKKDYISFVLVGTERTLNDINTNESKKGYYNIFQYSDELQMPSWELLMNFYQFVNQTVSDKGEWLDALTVAFNMLKKGTETVKIQRLRIALFYDFNDGINSYGCFEDITQDLLEHEIELIVVSPNITFIDNKSNNFLPQAIFKRGKKSQQQVESEKYALRLVSDCNAKLCNCKDAEYLITRSKNKRPWTWKSQFRIGTKINVNIEGIIAAKDESALKLKKVWAEPGEVVTREWAYYIDGNRITPKEDDLIPGYMLGGTPIPYEEDVEDNKAKLPPGLTFIGFIPSDAVQSEYFTGNSEYVVLHQRGKTESARFIDGLVRSLLKLKRVILCWKVYSEKFNKPKIVVLIPNEIKDDAPASLNMYELAYHNQYNCYDFPKLTSKSTECSDEQLKAIDNLIDCMDLTMEGEDGEEQPRETLEKDLLPFNNLPDIFERNLADVIERKILCKATEDDEFFEELLKDKNFKERFWKVPEEIEEKAKEAAKEVKRLFPLKVTNQWLDKAKEKARLSQHPADPNEEPSTSGIELSFDHVRTSTPASDFEQLLKAYVFPIKDSTKRDMKFNHFASQIRAVIRDLIFKPKSPNDINMDKVTDALTAYRKRCFIFNAFDDYNTWISSIKNEVVNRRMAKFWQDVVVKHELGLCFIGEPSLDEQIKEKEFYSLEFCDGGDSAGNSEQMEMNDSEMDNLLANLP